MVLVVPSRFDPRWSLLGRWLRRRCGDERRAEALLIVVLTGVGGALLLLYQAAWALPRDPSGGMHGTAWGLAAAGVLAGLVGVLGFSPRITIRSTAAGLEAEQGTRRVTLPWGTIRGAEPLSPLLFHRHYRRYAATRAFVNRIDGDLLLLRTDEGPVVLGLPPAGRAALLAAWQAAAS